MGASEGLYFGCRGVCRGTRPLCSREAFECYFVEIAKPSCSEGISGTKSELLPSFGIICRHATIEKRVNYHSDLRF